MKTEECTNIEKQKSWKLAENKKNGRGATKVRKYGQTMRPDLQPRFMGMPMK